MTPDYLLLKGSLLKQNIRHLINAQIWIWPWQLVTSVIVTLSILSGLFAFADVSEDATLSRQPQRYARLLMVNDAGMPLQKMIQKYGLPTSQVYWAVKLQGKASYFIFQPEDPDHPEVPDKYKTFVELETSYNVPDRIAEIPTPENRKPVRVYHFDVPLEDVNVYQSRFITEKERGFLLVDETTKDQFSPTPFIVKMQKIISSKPYNSAETVSNAVNVNEALESIILEREDEGFTILPERLGVTLQTDDDLVHTNLVRSLTPQGDFVSPFAETYPLHGFLGSHLLREAAEKMGLSEDEWILQEYLPKLARFSAVTNFVHGVYFQAHTQNQLIRVHSFTGEIEDFPQRDLNDVLIDEHLRRSLGKSIYSNLSLNSTRIYGQMHFNHVDSHSAKDAGWNLALYTGQSVLLSAQRDLGRIIYLPEAYPQSHTFLSEYLSEAQRVSGVTIQLSRASKNFMNELAQVADPNFPRYELSQIEGEYTSLRNGMALVLQDIYNQVSRHITPTIKPEMIIQSQSTLRKIFKDHVISRNVTLTTPDSRRLFENIFSRRRIRYAYNRETQEITAFLRTWRQTQILGTAYQLTDLEVSQIEEEASSSWLRLPSICRLIVGQTL